VFDSGYVMTGAVYCCINGWIYWPCSTLSKECYVNRYNQS
jgi:hypothetical protein